MEISAHGSPVILNAIVKAAIFSGARLAEPGEFTLRAFLNGRIDLMQAEAVADLIDAATPLQARAAFDQLNGTLTLAIAAIDAALFDLVARLEASVDFPEEGYHFVEPGELAAAIDTIRERTTSLLRDAKRGRILREGLQVAIVGAPNVGKSSLFNALVGASRAIVTTIPGTTRDLVSETIDLEGLRVTVVDTAGLRATDDRVESEGVSRATAAAANADLILFVVDLSTESSGSEEEILGSHVTAVTTKRVVVANKSDLPARLDRGDAIAVSALTGMGLDELRRAIVKALGIELMADRPDITNIRHIALVERADQSAWPRAVGGTCGRAVDVGRVCASGSSGGARRARLGDLLPGTRGSARAHFFAVLYRQMTFDVIVVGAGHAGCEAAYAAARLGAHVALCTLGTDTVAHMPCNPAIGGTAKGHLVREIDALGGLMGRAIDATAIQFKLLNRSRGPAVWSPRAQADKKAYGDWVRRELSQESNIEWVFGRAARLLVQASHVIGMTLEDG